MSEKQKKKELTDKEKMFLKVLFNEAKGNISKALEMSGYTATTPSEIVRRLGQEIREGAEAVLAMNAPLASLSMVGAVTDPNAAGTANKIKAATDILDRVGITKKTNEEIKINTGTGLVVLPAKDIDPDLLARAIKKETPEDEG